MSNLILEEIITLKNQNELYLIKDEEGVFVPQEKSTQILSCTFLHGNKKTMF